MPLPRMSAHWPVNERKRLLTSSVTKSIQMRPKSRQLEHGRLGFRRVSQTGQDLFVNLRLRTAEFRVAHEEGCCTLGTNARRTAYGGPYGHHSQCTCFALCQPTLVDRCNMEI